MDISSLLERLDALEKRIAELEAENQQLREENATLKERIAELEEALKNKADSLASKKPQLNYGVDRNKPTPQKQKKKRKRRKPSTGRVPDAQKFEKADDIVSIYPDNLAHADCILRDEQGVWRLIDGKAKYVHYRIHAPENAKNLPKIPGVRNSRSEYGIEIIIVLAFLVYWIGISMDKACEVFHFFTGLVLSKGQADSLLYQLAKDWEVEYENIAKLIVNSAILYIDETGWKVGKKNLYTWIFSTMSEVLYKVGVGRGKDVLDEMLGGQFAGTGVSDDYAAYDSAFAKHQLCWAHPLRKALELMLRNPENKEYKRFVTQLFNAYYEAVRLSKDKRLSVGREEKAKDLEKKLRRICGRAGEMIVTEKMVAAAKKADPQSSLVATSDSDAKFIRLHNQLVEKCSCFFVFVCDPSVESTNNRSERAARPEAVARKAARTSKTDKGAKRRGVIMTVFASLKKRWKDFSLANIVAAVQECIQNGVALFKPVIEKPPE
jgi:regulator of replication initiation timing